MESYNAIVEDNNVVLKKISDGQYKLLKKKSKCIVWNVFYEIQRADGSILEERVYCQVCRKLYKFTKKQLSNLLKHKCVHSQSTECNPVQVTNEDKNACFETCMNFTIEDCRPFSTVDGSGFRKMVAKYIKIGAKYGENVDLDQVIPSSRTLSQQAKLIAEEKKEQIKPHIQNLIANGEAAVTIDTWTDDFIKRNFLCATLHFQINYENVDITLGVKSMDFTSNTAINIRSKLNNIFEEFGVSDITNTTFVTDRGSNINIVSALDDLTRLNCSAHLFSNVLNDAFESTNELKAITTACENIVQYFKKSNKQHMLDTSLKYSCPTRWNSNFTMFKSILDNYTKISQILVEIPAGRYMVNINPAVLQNLVQIFSDFDIIFKQLQYSISPTLCFVIPSINRVKMTCVIENNEEPDIAALKRNIMLHLEKWSSNLNILHKAALFLYPPAMSLLSHDINNVKEFVIKKMQSDYPFCSVFPGPAEQARATQNNATQIVSESPMSSISSQGIPPTSKLLLPSTTSSTISGPSTRKVSFFFPSLLKNVSEPTPEKDEVERYSNEKVILAEDFDVMLWWKNNSPKYPKLAKIATKLLSIPASSAASERVFSLCGNIVTEKRNNFEPKTIDSIIFLNSLLNKNLW